MYALYFCNALSTESKTQHSTGCLLISVACLSIHNLFIFWSLRAEILNTLTSKVYKFIHLIRQIKSSSKHNQIAICIFWQIQRKSQNLEENLYKNLSFCITTLKLRKFLQIWV